MQASVPAISFLVRSVPICFGPGTPLNPIEFRPRRWPLVARFLLVSRAFPVHRWGFVRRHGFLSNSVRFGLISSGKSRLVRVYRWIRARFSPKREGLELFDFFRFQERFLFVVGSEPSFRPNMASDDGRISSLTRCVLICYVIRTPTSSRPCLTLHPSVFLHE